MRRRRGNGRAGVLLAAALLLSACGGRTPAAGPTADRRGAVEVVRGGADRVTDAELHRLTVLLATHANDPAFAEHFATGTGARATLAFYAAMAQPRQYEAIPRRHGEHRRVQLPDLEAALGTTLATATSSGSPGMRRWTREVIALGGQDVGDNAQAVYGFQAMSDLMRHGTYDTGFLRSYGTALLSFEKAHTTDEIGGLQRRVVREHVLPWNRTGDWVRLHYGTGGTPDDPGDDPMTGYAEALGHNPGAATSFFTGTARFDYLTRDRRWPGAAGYDALGHALEAATMGAPYDADPPRLHRTNSTAAVMARVVERYSYADVPGGPALGPAIGDSLGRMTAAYIDDLGRGLDLGPQRPVALFPRRDLQPYLLAIGQDDAAYRAVSNAQLAYTTSVLFAHPPSLLAHGEVDDIDAHTAVRRGAEVQGLLDAAWIHRITVRGVISRHEFWHTVDQRAQTQHRTTGTPRAGLFTFGTATPPSAGSRGATVVPLATVRASAVLDGRIGRALATAATSKRQELMHLGEGQIQDIRWLGREASEVPADQFLRQAAHDRWPVDSLQEVDNDLDLAGDIGYNSTLHAY